MDLTMLYRKVGGSTIVVAAGATQTSILPQDIEDCYPHDGKI